MLKQMRTWFDDNNTEKQDNQIYFDPKTINLTRLIKEQDINEILVLTEFIMVIVV